MPEHLAPGVYIEEVGLRSTAIEGVPTSVAVFLGRTQRGPKTPTVVTSFAEYRRRFGGAFSDTGYMFHALCGFFENGGRRAVIVRITRRGALRVAEFEAGLAALDASGFDDVSLVHAPNAPAVPGLAAALAAYCERSRYRFAVLDAPAGSADPQAPADTRYAALYHPWIEIADPLSGARRRVPPGGHVLGVFARVDAERGVHKAPANEAVRGAVGLAAEVTAAQQDALNARGVNVIRRFAGRGILLWGARTLSSDPEWKYVNVRRLFIYLERSIDLGTQWVVFEPNGEALWAKVRHSIEDFLTGLWRSGALAGDRPERAFFVRCDRTTMTQADIETGRLVCVIGVAPVKPAEFVLFRIGQWTADRPD